MVYMEEDLDLDLSLTTEVNMFVSPFILANKEGIPRLESTGVSVSTTNVKYSFRNHRFLSFPFIGLILFKLDQAIPAGTTGTLPIVFDTNGRSQELTTLGGTAVTAADLTETGIYLAAYDSTSGVLQLLTGI